MLNEYYQPTELWVMHAFELCSARRIEKKTLCYDCSVCNVADKNMSTEGEKEKWKKKSDMLICYFTNSLATSGILHRL